VLCALAVLTAQTLNYTKMKISRKTKKELKKQILSNIDSAWKSKELIIDKVEKFSRYATRNATYKGLTVTSYRLG
jgi:lipid II:glycine glycyltransferase (peptidoglycan interpeptide bridge formation enzyme)